MSSATVANEFNTSNVAITFAVFCTLLICSSILSLISQNALYSRLITFSSAPRISFSTFLRSSVINLSQFANVCLRIYLSGTIDKLDLVTSIK